MNKKYIDFVPAKSTKIEKRPLNSGRSVSVKMITGKPVAKKKTALEEAKSQKLVGRELGKAGMKSVENFGEIEAAERKKSEKTTYKVPNHLFINQEKVVKRPLSKNVYQRKVETTEEKPSGPVTIIAKPEKDKSISLVVTIIITIILGAAAGTVAFLLLPK